MKPKHLFLLSVAVMLLAFLAIWEVTLMIFEKPVKPTGIIRLKGTFRTWTSDTIALKKVFSGQLKDTVLNDSTSIHSVYFRNVIIYEHSEIPEKIYPLWFHEEDGRDSLTSDSVVIMQMLKTK